MEPIIAQIPQQELLAALMATGARSGRQSAALGGGDPFLQIIENMVAQMLEGGDEGQTAGQTDKKLDESLLAGFAGMLFAAPDAGLPDGLETTSQQTDLLLEQLSAMQGQGANRLQAMPEDARQMLLQLTAQSTQTGTARPLDREGQAMAAQQSQPQAETVDAPATLSTAARAAAQTTPQTTPQAAELQATFAAQLTAADQPQTTRPSQRTDAGGFQQAVRTEASSEDQTQTMVTAPQPRTESGENESLFDGQRRFGSAVAQARELLRGQDRKSQSKTETEPLQLPLEPQKLQPQSAIVKLAQPKSVQTPSLLEQLTDGLQEELSAGKSQFTMKLKPEALGEITVKLTEKAGKMVLDITTASTQTAKLLNAELSALRETMKPMQVEVHEAVSQSGQSGQTQMQFNMSSQQFANQQRNAAWQQETPYYAASDGGEAEGDPQPAANGQEPAGLNLYV